MAQMINYGSEMLRIDPTNDNRIQYSTNDGRSWNTRCSSSSYGDFKDLVVYGSDIFAIMSKGVYCSTNEGRTWNVRCTSTSYGQFESLMVSGRELIAQTTKGTYVSTNEGRTWSRRN